MPRLPILTFHSIDVSGSVISVSPNDFAAHINTLAVEGWQSCTVSQVLEWRQRGDLPGRTVAITFDDGYRNVFEAALPVLRDHGFTATVFVTAGRCGSDNRWPGQPSQIPTLPMLSWDDVSALSRAGWEIGAQRHYASSAHVDRQRRGGARGRGIPTDPQRARRVRGGVVRVSVWGTRRGGASAGAAVLSGRLRNQDGFCAGR